VQAARKGAGLPPQKTSLARLSRLPPEVLKEDKWQAGWVTEPPLGEASVTGVDELRRRGAVGVP
jgi:hypothetical protein